MENTEAIEDSELKIATLESQLADAERRAEQANNRLKATLSIIQNMIYSLKGAGVG
jgi:chaperonin cofactor prefoldin